MYKLYSYCNSIANFLRFEYLPGTLIPPFFGALASGVLMKWWLNIGFIAVVLTYHIYGSLQNDLIDLPRDKTNPDRANYPLVKGTISSRVAFLLMCLQPLLLLCFLYLLQAPLAAYMSIAIALFTITIYNFLNKKSKYPIVMDIIQSVAFCTPIFFGASFAGNISIVIYFSFFISFIWMTFLNLLGGIRDLHSDYSFGVNTSPISLGSRPLSEKLIYISAATSAYGYILHLLTLVGGLLLIVTNTFNYSPDATMLLIFLVVLYGIFSSCLLIIFFRASSINHLAMLAAGYLYLGITSLILLVIIIPMLPVYLVVLSSFFLLWIYRKYKITPLLSFIKEHWVFRKK